MIVARRHLEDEAGVIVEWAAEGGAPGDGREVDADIGECGDAGVEAVDGLANALSTTNSLTARVAGTSGELLFGGLKRSIGGAAIACWSTCTSGSGPNGWR